MEDIKINQAKEIFGDDVTSVVLEITQVSDPDGAYTLFEDMGYFDHAECVAFLYFGS